MARCRRSKAWQGHGNDHRNWPRHPPDISATSDGQAQGSSPVFLPLGHFLPGSIWRRGLSFVDFWDNRRNDLEGMRIKVWQVFQILIWDNPSCFAVVECAATQPGLSRKLVTFTTSHDHRQAWVRLLEIFGSIYLGSVLFETKPIKYVYFLSWQPC